MTSKANESALVTTLENFKKTMGRREVAEYETTTLRTLETSIRDIQAEQHSKRCLQDMNRLKQYMEAMKQFMEVAKALCNRDDIMAFIWGPTKRLLQISSTVAKPFGQLLDAYERMGENMPLLGQYIDHLGPSSHMIHIIKLIYEDILKFHQLALQYFQQPKWEQLFETTWGIHKSRLHDITSSIARHRSLIESKASMPQIQESNILQQREHHQREEELDTERLGRLQAVNKWLKPTDVETDQVCYSRIRSECPGSGRWLLKKTSFQEWFDPRYPVIPPLLWLNGIPGAGKTVLASLVIEEAQKLPNAPTVLFFYCRYDNPEKDNFGALARSLLAQLLKHDQGLLPYFYEKCCSNGEALLTSQTLIEDLLRLAFAHCKCAYIIIDGLDECSRDARKDISKWLRNLVENLPACSPDRLRCLFISQDDGIARKDFLDLTSIKLDAEDTTKDIEVYSRIEADKVKEKFQLSDERTSAIAATVTNSGGGMFLFVKLVWSNLLGQTSVSSLEEELEDHNFPKGIDDALEILMLFGWLVCAKRSLKWREIQCLKSIDPDELAINDSRRFVVAPKELCGSLVEVRSDQTLELVHQTVKFFLIEDNHIDPVAGELKLACLCIDYLNQPAFISPPDRARVLKGDYVFMDYAVLYWVRHLELGTMRDCAPGHLMDQLAESLSVFIQHHWAFPSITLPVPNRCSNRLQFFKSRPFYKKLEQTVVSTKKQLNFYGEMRKEEVALNLPEIVRDVRAIMERMMSEIEPLDRNRIREKYGNDLFKCSRFSCDYFTIGLSSAEEQKKHKDRHDRPFRCTDEACPGFTLGYVSARELHRHINETHTQSVTQDQDFPTDGDIQHSMEKRPLQAQAETEFAEPSESETGNEPVVVLRRKRPRQTSFTCEHCGTVFNKRSNWRSHLLTHESEPQHKCDTCGKSFVRRSDHRRHMDGHRFGKPYTCRGILQNGNTWGCGRSFARSDTLENHYKSKRGKKCLQERDQKVLEVEQIPPMPEAGS
ncbi:hypothetical protein QQS21_003366 [Conoideocrella luteorostrata]|uniref:C2H2-type domain-containing protein n=1 Tax=Conoideocrella luteorostrata TaxID=1105319 RepID=A0AAJ0CTF1_9HYPO|nr:hypothetical protein QQS21_003366 [Conoideocrella luteorostrata]